MRKIIFNLEFQNLFGGTSMNTSSIDYKVNFCFVYINILSVHSLSYWKTISIRSISANNANCVNCNQWFVSCRKFTLSPEPENDSPYYSRFIVIGPTSSIVLQCTGHRLVNCSYKWKRETLISLSLSRQGRIYSIAVRSFELV